MAKLGEICAFQSGGTPSKNKPEYFGGEIPWISTTALNGGKINEADAVTWITPKAIRESAAKIVPANSIMVGTRVGIGKVAINTVEMSTSQDVISLIGIDKDKWYKPYLCKLLLSKKDYFNSQARGATIKGIKIDVVANIDVPEIDYATQRKVAATLNKIDTLIFLRKQQLEKLDELVKARFVEMFGDPVSNPMGWKRVRFDSISENLDSKRVPVTESDRKDGVYPYYGASGIVDWINDYIFDEDILLVSEDGANLLMRSTPIAFSVSGKSWVNNHAHVVRFHDFATQKFIEVYFSLIDISEYITGTAQPKLNQAKLNTMLFCWPPLSLQKQFAAFVERVDQQKQTVQQSLEKLELMKKALMQEYFG